MRTDSVRVLCDRTSMLNDVVMEALIRDRQAGLHADGALRLPGPRRRWRARFGRSSAVDYPQPARRQSRHQPR